MSEETKEPEATPPATSEVPFDAVYSAFDELVDTMSVPEAESGLPEPEIIAKRATDINKFVVEVSGVTKLDPGFYRSTNDYCIIRTGDEQLFVCPIALVVKSDLIQTMLDDRDDGDYLPILLPECLKGLLKWVLMWLAYHQAYPTKAVEFKRELDGDGNPGKLVEIKSQSPISHYFCEFDAHHLEHAREIVGDFYYQLGVERGEFDPLKAYVPLDSSTPTVLTTENEDELNSYVKAGKGEIMVSTLKLTAPEVDEVKVGFAIQDLLMRSLFLAHNGLTDLVSMFHSFVITRNHPDHPQVINAMLREQTMQTSALHAKADRKLDEFMKKSPDSDSEDEGAEGE